MPDSNEVTRDAVEARLAAWRRTGSLDGLWPDVTYAERRRALGRIKTVAARMLAPNDDIPTLPDDGSPRTLGVAAFIAGMGPLLGWWIERGQLATTAAASEVFARHLQHGARRSERLRAQVVRIASAMHDAGVRPVLLKGLHTGADFLPHPATRPAADIDLLIASDERLRALEVLQDLGFVQARRTKFAARSEWVLPEAPTAVRSLELDHADNPWSVDLLFALERWYYRGTRRDLGPGALETTRTIDVDGRLIRVLDQPYLAAFHALHASYDLHKMQLIRLVELALMCRVDAGRGRLDWDAFGSLLDRTDTWRFTYPALALAEDLLPGAVESSIALKARQASSPRLRRVVTELRHAEMGPLPKRSVRTKLAWAIGWRETFRAVGDVIAPSDDASGGLRRVYAKRAAIAHEWVLRRHAGRPSSGAGAGRTDRRNHPSE